MDVTARTYPFARERPFEMPEEFAWLRANAPISQVKLANGSPAWLITRYEDVRAALGDARLSRGISRPGAAPVDTGFKVGGDSPLFNFGGSISEGPGHVRWRRLVSRAFTARQAESMRPRIAELTDRTIDDMVAGGAPADLMADFAFRLPITLICELLGVPQEGREQFAGWAAKLTRRDLQSSWDEFGAAMQSIGRYAAGLIVRKRKNLGDDLLSTLITVHDDDEEALTNEELVSTVLLLLMAGYESTAVQFGNAFFALFHHRDQLERLRRDPPMVRTAVEEILRYAQLGTGFAVAKFATEDLELGGVTIAAGATVFVSLGSANRDEAVFDDAATFDVGNRGAARQIAFSAGPHYCLGASLARVELQEGIAGLLRRLPGLAPAGDLADVVLASNLFTFYPRELPVIW